MPAGSGYSRRLFAVLCCLAATASPPARADQEPAPVIKLGAPFAECCLRNQQSSHDERIRALEIMNAELMKRLDALTASPSVILPAAAKSGDDKKAEENKVEKKDDWFAVGSNLKINSAINNQNQLTFATPNQDFFFQPTGRLEWDMGVFNQSAGMANYQDAGGMRRARIGMIGRMWENIYWKVAYDFADSNGGVPNTNFRDAYIRIEQLPVIKNVQIGQYKDPINLSWLNTANELIFLERGIAVDAFIPPRSTGVMIYRTFADERIWYANSFTRNVVNDGGFSQGDGQYAWVTRLTGLPYWSDDGRYFVHVGAGYSRRAFGDNNHPIFAKRAEIRLGTPRVLDTDFIIGASQEDLFNGEFATVLGPFSLQAEVITVNLGGDPGPDYWGGYVMTSYFLTGENRRYTKSLAHFNTVVPNENFFCMAENGRCVFGKGAWELAGRYSYLDLRNSAWVEPTTKDGAGGTGIYQSLSFAVNWYLNPHTTIMMDYIRGYRASDTPGRSGFEDTFAMRLRWWF